MSTDAWSVGCCIIMMSSGKSPWVLDKSYDPYIDIIRVSGFTANVILSLVDRLQRPHLLLPYRLV